MGGGQENEFEEEMGEEEKEMRIVCFAWVQREEYGVATFCRLPRISGVLCKRALQYNGSFLEGTYLFGQPAKTLAFGISMRWL